MVGKYAGLSNSYLSVLKALVHASVACRQKLIVEWVAAGELEDITANPDVYKAVWDRLKGVMVFFFLGGFSDRGVQGKILAAKYAREKNVPFLGICLGVQIIVIEFVRSVLGLHDVGISFMQVDDYERRQTLVNLKMFKGEDLGRKTRNTISIKECEGASESKGKSKNQVERTKERIRITEITLEEDA
ncbi:CTP synthase [Morella rubra]|uniref:CTP synthase (glutamine hydrolyzing) n=1 Tax=Morella rubra TaxID=262757 RepID=A0A6A1WJE9_9ROSI|nr:CTP synthase [Morella rubra]